ncbi:hypothetical protein HJG60_008684 [Phyllostomus discolor]|uniref:Uncharacterized protein n=1 Tax=Phyllostomus discolor TaxID=89673 RepID=A0A833Z1V9_9CHIR|nr:hypothetical protein HJG60_008684 [Phyllostomus discolor]
MPHTCLLSGSVELWPTLCRGCLHDLHPVKTPGTGSAMLSGVTALSVPSQSVAGGRPVGPRWERSLRCCGCLPPNPLHLLPRCVFPLPTGFGNPFPGVNWLDHRILSPGESVNRGGLETPDAGTLSHFINFIFRMSLRTSAKTQGNVAPLFCEWRRGIFLSLILRCE